MSIVTVRPKLETPGGIKMVTHISQIGVYDGGEKGGTQTRTEKQTFKGGMFPGTRQPYLPKWSERRGYVLMKKNEKGKLVELTNDELNADVKECYFYTTPDNKPIEIANRKNRFDPFFQTLIKKRPLMRFEGRVELDTEKPLDRIWIALLMADIEEFGISGERGGMTSASQRSIIVDRSMDTANETSARLKRQEVAKLWEAMEDDEPKLRRIARIANLTKAKQATSLDDVKNAVYSMSQDDKTYVNKDKGETRQDLFVQLAKLETEKLGFKDYVALAKEYGYIKKQSIDKKDVYLIMGTKCGSTLEAVEEYLTRSDNSQTLKDLTELIDSKLGKAEKEKEKEENK